MHFFRLNPVFSLLVILFFLFPLPVGGEDGPKGSRVAGTFLAIAIGDEEQRSEALRDISENWQDNFVPMVLETIHLGQNREASVQLIELLQERTGQDFGFDINSWYVWLWQQPAVNHPEYASFKSQLYRLIDPRFEKYFSRRHPVHIRLDEVRWGGVRQDGIPPLRSPKMLGAAEARYLSDSDIVFGLEVNGDVRAYPKRILAWHEMFTDSVGGEEVTGVYCTLCGSMILYKSSVNGRLFRLGTSGFLYRSNKLMYDQETSSLWSTLLGEPVVGPLANKGISLERLSVVTTTWGEWKRRHPGTMVLSLETGYSRDYGEGVAYRRYFATDELMFVVPKRDERLLNKAEVLGLVLGGPESEPLAISSKFLGENPVYRDSAGNVEFVVLTDPSGAHRVYATDGLLVSKWDGEETVWDKEGGRWKVGENGLYSESGVILPRLPTHNVFWFAWFAQYPNTRLVQ